jgi:hypothetical protein
MDMKMKFDNCGTEFETPDYKKKYCCETCMTKAGIKSKKEKKSQDRKRECRLCGETFIPARSDSEFCSVKCRQTAYRERKSSTKSTEVKKAFILKIGKLHRKILNDFSKYIILDIYNFCDVVDALPSSTYETCLIYRETGELLKTWSEPFSESYESEKSCTRLSPDSIIYTCHLLIRDYEMKTGRSFIYRAAMDYMIRNSTY